MIDFALVHPDVVHGHDTGMVQLREPPRLLPRPFGVSPLSGRGAQHLDGDGPIELAIVAQIDGAEAAGPQETPHLIAAEGRRDGDAGRGAVLR